jgi:hypothetical protein
MRMNDPVMFSSDSAFDHNHSPEESQGALGQAQAIRQTAHHDPNKSCVKDHDVQLALNGLASALATRAASEAFTWTAVTVRLSSSPVHPPRWASVPAPKVQLLALSL